MTTGLYFSLSLDLQLFRIYANFIRQYTLSCIYSNCQPSIDANLEKVIFLAVGCSSPSISNSVKALLPFLGTLDPLPAPLRPQYYEEILQRVATEVREQKEILLFELFQLERLAPYFPEGKEHVSVIVMQCISSISGSVNALARERRTINVGLLFFYLRDCDLFIFLLIIDYHH